MGLWLKNRQPFTSLHCLNSFGWSTWKSNHESWQAKDMSWYIYQEHASDVCSCQHQRGLALEDQVFDSTVTCSLYTHVSVGQRFLLAKADILWEKKAPNLCNLVWFYFHWILCIYAMFNINLLIRRNCCKQQHGRVRCLDDSTFHSACFWVPRIGGPSFMNNDWKLIKSLCIMVHWNCEEDVHGP